MSEPDLAGMSPAVVGVIARGLYWLAASDGVDDREVALIKEFLEETGSQWTIDDLQQEEFDPRDLPAFLDTSFLRHIFLKCAVAMVAADGEISAAEQKALHRCARFLGLTDKQYEELEAEARSLTIPQDSKASATAS